MPLVATVQVESLAGNAAPIRPQLGCKAWAFFTPELPCRRGYFNKVPEAFPVAVPCSSAWEAVPHHRPQLPFPLYPPYRSSSRQPPPALLP